MAERTCIIEDCDRAPRSRGMCPRHYRYWLDHTPPEQRPTPPRFARTFDDFVVKIHDRGCWIWTGPVDVKGYGRWSGAGFKGLAHRFALAAVAPPPDPDLFACHHCDNPPCVNPAHLYWGTVADNVADMVARKGMHNKGVYKSHCDKGHELAGDNLRIAGKQKKRTCRICGNERARKWQAERRGKQPKATPPPDSLKTRNAVTLYGVSKETLFRWQKRGLLRAVKIGGNSWWPVAELERATRVMGRSSS